MLEQWRAGLRVSEALALEVGGPLPRCRASDDSCEAGQGQKGKSSAGAPGVGSCVLDGADEWQCLRGRRSQNDDVGLDAEGSRESRASRCVRVGIIHSIRPNPLPLGDGAFCDNYAHPYERLLRISQGVILVASLKCLWKGELYTTACTIGSYPTSKLA